MAALCLFFSPPALVEAIVEPLAGVCFCASSCGTCCFLQRVLPQVTLRRLRNLSGSSCLSCSCGGAMSVGFAVSLVWRLVFYLMQCSSSDACGFARLTLPQVTLRDFCLFWPRLPDQLLRCWRRLGCHPYLVFSVLLLHRLACQGLLDSAPCDRELPWWL